MEAEGAVGDSGAVVACPGGAIAALGIEVDLAVVRKAAAIDALARIEVPPALDQPLPAAHPADGGAQAMRGVVPQDDGVALVANWRLVDGGRNIGRSLAASIVVVVVYRIHRSLASRLVVGLVYRSRADWLVDRYGNDITASAPEVMRMLRMSTDPRGGGQDTCDHQSHDRILQISTSCTQRVGKAMPTQKYPEEI